jgi:uncharacterized protein (DUF488 family)
MKIYTIGHSTRSIEDFIDILKHYNIELVVDVRMYPGSIKSPWFGKDSLAKLLNESGIEYLHYPELGGFRKGGYAAFAETEEFQKALDKLIEIINSKSKTTAIMCAELLWFRCHRRHIAERLVKMGHGIVHIYNKEKIDTHKPHDEYIKEKMNLKIWCDKKARKFTTENGS